MPRRPQRKLSLEETEERMREGRTQGREGLSLPRINFRFKPDIYEYVKTMSSDAGMTMTGYINRILAEHKASHEAEYAEIRATEIRAREDIDQ